MVDGGDDLSRTICSICFEDLKPIIEDLQSISICGHVFHELCLQQWFEYCSSTKRYSCPVCKQSCKPSNAARLYFQSVGYASNGVLPGKPIDFEEDVGVLRKEVKRLEVKVSGLSSTLDQQGKELGELNEELRACREKAKLETRLKDEALKQKASIQHMLQMKSEELEKSNLDCLRLQDRNMALAKELAAFKLVSDLDLDEEEVLKLATLGNGANSKDTIETLKRSLVMRNRSYKDLMAKCNLLGRGEARYSRKLEKAKEKINKLEERVQELETAAEAKENEALRSLKVSKKTSCSKKLENGVHFNSDLLPAGNILSKEQVKQFLTPKSRIDPTVNVISKSLESSKIENYNVTEYKDVNSSIASRTTVYFNEKRDCISVEDASEFTKAFPGPTKYNCKDQDSEDVTLCKPTLTRSEVVNGIGRETTIQGEWSLVEPLRFDTDKEIGDIPAGAMDDDVTILDKVKQVQPMINIRKEHPSPLTLSSGDSCFAGGLLGPDGTHRYLGKWCKRGQKRDSVSAKGSINGDLIAVGGDGRGGRVKVLRSLNQSFPDGKENSVSSKRSKFGPKANCLPSQGCLQIEHFFGRVSQ